MKRIPPYYSNTDGTECAQCVLRMGLEYFEGADPTMAEMYRLTGKVPGKTTWNMRSYVEMQRRGYDLVIHDPYDYAALAADPIGYIRADFSPSDAEWTIANSDLDAAVADAKLLLQPGGPQVSRENYTLAQMRVWLDDGYLIGAWVNDAVVQGPDGAFLPHFILVFDYDADGFIAHNSGGANPGDMVPSQYIPNDVFERANKIDGRRTGEMMAFRKQPAQ